MRDRLWTLAVFCLSLLVYVLTLSPHVSFTDSGELAGACASLGVAHPTGYPLFVILGFLWIHLPLPLSVIAKLNLFAAVCTAFSASALYRICRELLQFIANTPHGSLIHASHTSTTPAKSGRRKAEKSSHVSQTVDASQATTAESLPAVKNTLLEFCSASMALTYAYGQTVWAQAQSIEVYSLHLMMMTLTLYWTLRAVTTPNRKALIIAALCLGLSFTNHLTTILLIVPITVLFFYRPAESFSFSSVRRREFLMMLGVVVSCAIVYVILPLRSSAEPWFNWGAVHRGWEQFSYHVFGKQYSVWMFSGEKGVVAKQFGVFLRLVPQNLAYVGILFAAWGLVTLFSNVRTRPLATFFTLMIVCGVSYSVNYNIHDIDSYFLSSVVALVVLSTVGLYNVLQRIPRFAALCFLVPCISLGTNWKHCDEHDNVLVREYVHMMVDPLPQNALLISQQWDYFCSAFWYMQQVEGYRPDITMVEKELLRRTWFANQLRRWYPDAIAPSQKVIDDFMTDLRDFEQDPESFKTDPRKPVTIQRKYIGVLNSLVDNNIDRRSVFVTQEVFQGEDGFAKTYFKSPYALTIRLSHTQPTDMPDTSQIQIETFATSSARHHSEHLELDIAQAASRELEANIAFALALNRPADARWYAAAAVKLDPKNARATEALNRLSQKAPN